MRRSAPRTPLLPVASTSIVGLMRSAAAEGRPAIASAARPSMGGQSIARDGLTITLDQTFVETDQEARVYRVGGGSRWNEVIRVLDGQGFSPAVMQSNNDFGVASTFAVNAHGWPVPWSGCGSTVRSFRMLSASGKAIECSREENPETFRATMGGYGLTGIITDLSLTMVPNQLLEPAFEKTHGDDLGTRFREVLEARPAVSMAYGRLDVTIDGFFENALLVTYEPAADQDELPQAQGSGFISKALRHIFRAQLENEPVKRSRWWVETSLAPRIAAPVTRNSLLNEPVATLDDGDPDRTDILHEYFLPPERLREFLAVCRSEIPNSYQQLLNVTLRFVKADGESLLAYAPDDRIAAVMLFSQEKSARAEADMARLTRHLIDGALAAGGSYYLPYRLHASIEQFEAAYPKAREFIAAKKSIDPEGRFSNALWRNYLEPLA
jgi:FAD/FMN-containing dehydrogenase